MSESNLNWLFFHKVQKKIYFGGVCGRYTQNKIFSKKSVSFLPLGTLTSGEVSEKSYEPLWRKRICLLIYWHTDSGEIVVVKSFSPKGRGPKTDGDKLFKDLLTNKMFSKQILSWNVKMELYLNRGLVWEFLDWTLLILTDYF